MYPACACISLAFCLSAQEPKALGPCRKYEGSALKTNNPKLLADKLNIDESEGAGRKIPRTFGPIDSLLVDGGTQLTPNQDV